MCDAFIWLREGRWMHARRNASATINRYCPSTFPFSFIQAALLQFISFIDLHPLACKCDRMVLSVSAGVSRASLAGRHTHEQNAGGSRFVGSQNR